MDPVRLAKRAERKRLAAYCLKPRFDYAFGSWAPEKLYWSFEGGCFQSSSINRKILT
jgi:hypothetical protein